jgi:hypothetical protein
MFINICEGSKIHSLEINSLRNGNIQVMIEYKDGKIIYKNIEEFALFLN